MHRKDLGTWGESIVITLLLENNINVYNSVGDNTRADIIAEDDVGLHKIQVKTRNRENETSKLIFQKNGPNYQFKYTEKHVDWFALVDVQTKKVAWIPSKYLRDYDRVITLRHDKPKNNQMAGILMFDDFTNIPFSVPQ